MLIHYSLYILKEMSAPFENNSDFQANICYFTVNFSDYILGGAGVGDLCSVSATMKSMYRDLSLTVYFHNYCQKLKCTKPLKTETKMSQLSKSHKREYILCLPCGASDVFPFQVC